MTSRETGMRFIDPTRDPWRGADDPVVPLRDQTLLTLEQWNMHRQTWPDAIRAGIVVRNDVDVEDLRPDLRRWSLIALQFPKWTDGRAYSQARLLRTRLRFDGEIRAVGEVLVDMLPLLHRTGFDAVVMRPDQSLDSAQRALRFFAAHYQGDVAGATPVIARQAA
jgi:uncharacterized protein (DUF934 family)